MTYFCVIKDMLMKFYSFLKVDENKMGALYEIPASFLFVILNFFLVR